MIPAIVAMVCAAIEFQIACFYQLAGNAGRTRAHGGWAILFCAGGFYCAITHWIFG